jgi:2-deoxy-D-gluconate 3-dehydrogenase
MQVNIHSVFSLCRDFGAYLLKESPLEQTVTTGSERRGSVINVASLMSFQGGLFVPAYASAKGAVASLTKALSNEWAGHGITVNAIAPGYIRTNMTDSLVQDPTRAPGILERIPAGRWGQPDDFKGVVIWLASRAGAYVSGEIVTVDGGWMGR